MDFQPGIILNAIPLLAEGLSMTLKFSAASFVLALAIGFAVGILRYRSVFFFSNYFPRMWKLSGARPC